MPQLIEQKVDDPDVVFGEKSMMSLAGRPVTRGHPPAGVSAESWRDLGLQHMAVLSGVSLMDVARRMAGQSCR